MFRNAFLASALCLAGVAGAAEAQEAGGQWQGPYAGIHVGGIYGSFDNRVPLLPGPTEDSGSVIGGLQLGYNLQRGDMVYGVEADVSIMNVYGRSPGGRFDEDAMASLRLRAGKIVGGTLVYGSLGAAFTEKRMALTGLGADTEWEPGLMVGIGGERWVSDTATARLELFYVDVPKSRQIVGGIPTSGGSGNAILRAGLNLHF